MIGTSPAVGNHKERASDREGKDPAKAIADLRTDMRKEPSARRAEQQNEHDIFGDKPHRQSGEDSKPSCERIGRRWHRPNVRQLPLGGLLFLGRPHPIGQEAETQYRNDAEQEP